jgi:hypothetical protein
MADPRDPGDLMAIHQWQFINGMIIHKNRSSIKRSHEKS